MTNISQFSKGCIPDTPDYRDVPLGAVQEAVIIPESYFTQIDDLGVNSQKSQPSCVAHAADKIKEYQEREDWKKVFNFSPRFVYALSKKIDGWAGDGTYLRIGMKVLADYGICFEREFADNSQLSKDEYRDWSKIPADAYTTAGAYKITSYARVDTNFEMLKQAIFQNGMVMMGFTGTNKGWQNARIVQPQLGEPTSDYWGHAVVAYGYDKDYIYFVNSWGISWGNQGKGFFGRDYTNIQDAWVSVDIQDNLINQYKLMKIIGENATKKQYVLMPNGKDLRHIAGVGTLEAGHNDKLWDMRAVSWIDDFSMYNILPEDFIIAKV